MDDLTFTVEPGKVTGFLGPNGAGKSTTMRLILGLDRPDTGFATINGKPLAAHSRPLAEVGALLEAKAVHTGRTARNHLRALAATTGIGRGRVDEVLDMVGLTEVADKRAGKFSLGMGQRLGVASALLGDPQILILDEPVNGLDPDGVRWIRRLLRGLADEGRTVFLSSHLMSEMALIADHIVIVGRGRLLRDLPMRELIDTSTHQLVRLRTPDTDRFTEVLTAEGMSARRMDAQTLEVDAAETDQIGRLAARKGLTLLELTQVEGSLEEAYMSLTADEVEYGGEQPPSTRRTVASLLGGESQR